jgi:GntR family transcriptional regulator
MKVFFDTKCIAMSTPLHLSISEDLHRQILQGDYPPGAKLPSEHQLMASFEVSRITVRQAIANLASQGLVSAQQGKGVFVNERRKIAHSLSSPLVFVSDDMAQRGIDFSTQNLLFEAIAVPDLVRSALKMSACQSKVYVQQKLFLMNGAVGAIDISYIPLALGKRYGAALKTDMTFPILESHCIPIERVEALLECTHADSEISAHLNVPLGHPLMVYRYTAYTRNDRAIVYGESISRADRFCYTVTISKETAK